MKKFFIFSLLAALLYAPVSSAQVQTVPEQSNVGLLATVALSDASLVQDGRSATVSFSISNRSGVQSGVKYAVVLASETSAKEYIVDEIVNDDVLTLGENETVTRSVVYTAPSALSGTYTVYVLSKNETGLPFGMIRAGTLTLSPGTPGLVLDASSCYLTIKGNTKSPRYSVMQQATIAPTEQLVSHCILQNTSDSPLEISPVFVTHLNSTFGPATEAEGGDVAPLVMKAKEKKELVTVLPRGVVPQMYAVTLSYGQNSNAVTYNYSIVGNFGTIMNAYLDKTQYGVGDTAKLNVTWKAEGAGLSTLALKATLHDATGVQCGEVTQNVTVSKTTLVVLDVPITKACVDPSIALSLTDASLGMLDVGTFGAEAKAIQELESGMGVPEERPESIPPLWISFAGLLLALALLVYGIYKRGKVAPPSVTPLVILFAIMIFGSVGIHEAQAVSFTQNNGACAVSLSYDPVSQIRSGQTVNLYGYTSCPGLQVDAAFLAAGYGFSVTANAFGGFSGSFIAPPEDDVIQYVSGDWIANPLCSECTMPPSDFIFVNYCIPVTVDNCELPAESIFGTKVGKSGGACVSGSTGACNYTCQPDLTWKKNSNTCSVPPPPPSGYMSNAVFSATPNACGSITLSLTSMDSGPQWYVDARDNGTSVIYSPGTTASWSYTHPVAAGSSHNYTLTVTDNWGNSRSFGPLSPTGPPACAVPLPPTTPTGLSATAGVLCGSNVITVTWNTVSGATSYDLLRDGVLVNNVTSPYPHTVVSDGALHTYNVRAVSSVSGSSAWSTPQVSENAPSACVVADAPIGYLDGANCSVATGWTCDPDSWGTALDVHFYEGSTYLGNTTANVANEAAVTTACGGTSPHRFSFTIPNSLKDGASHTINAYPINIGNTVSGNPPVASARTISGCALPTYTYSFNGNGATTNPSPTSVTQAAGTSITPPTNPSRTEYTFNGWSPAIPATMPVGGGTSNAQWVLTLLPDLDPAPPTSAGSVVQGGTIGFTGAVTNTGGAVAGPYNVDLFYIDNNGDGIAEYTTGATRVNSSTGIGGSNNSTGSWSVPGATPTGNNYRIGYFVDTSGEVNEGVAGEGNNWSGWSAPFTVTAAGSPVLNFSGCDIPNGSSSCIAPMSTVTGGSGFYNLENRTTGVNISNVYGSGWYNGGAGTPAQLTRGTNTLVIVQGGVDKATAYPVAACVEVWNAGTGKCEAAAAPSLPCPQYSGNGCSIPPTAAGDTAAGTCDVASGYSGSCSGTCSPSGSGSWNLPISNGCTLTSPPPVSGPPTLTTPNRTVKVGSTVPLSWDTNNGDESLCTLTGGTLSGYLTLNLVDGGAEKGSVNQTITGRTTYTLTCQAGSAVLTIDVIPDDSET